MSKLSEYWLTLTPTGSIQGVSSIYPPMERDDPKEIAITKSEFEFLRHYKLDEARTLIRSIERKIRKVKS